jgi:hypothetical protein
VYESVGSFCAEDPGFFFCVVTPSGLLIPHISKELRAFDKCFGVLDSLTLADECDTFLHCYFALQPRRYESSISPLWKPQISLDAAKLFSTQFRLTVHMYSDTGTSKELILGLRIRGYFTGVLLVLIVGARRNMTVS